MKKQVKMGIPIFIFFILLGLLLPIPLVRAAYIGLERTTVGESVPPYPANIVVTNLSVNMTVKLYNSTGDLIASDQVGTGETNATLMIPSAYRSSTFFGDFRLYDADDLNLLTAEFDDVRGGDVYRSLEEGGWNVLTLVGIFLVAVVMIGMKKRW